MNTQATEVIGTMMGVIGVKLNNGDTLSVDGLFVAVGSTPFTRIVDGLTPEKDSE
jgi:thioredoxin reductase